MTTLTVKETAERLRLSEPTIRRWVADGILRGKRIGPRLIRITVDSVEEVERGGEAA